MTFAASPTTLRSPPTEPGLTSAPNWRRGYVDTPDGQVHYRSLCQGPALILLHQAPGSSAMWNGLMPELARLGHRCVAFDLPGYGMSDRHPRIAEVEDYARSIEQAALALGIDRYDLVGHHTGSSVALWMATGDCRQVGRMVLYGLPFVDAAGALALATEPPPVYEPEATEVTMWWQRLAKFLPVELAETLLPRYTADMLLPGRDRALAHHALGRSDHAARLRALTVPVLAVQGRRDVLFEATRKAAELSPWVDFREFGDAGIFVADEEPHAFAALVHEYLGQAA